MIKISNVKIPYKIPIDEYAPYVAKKLKLPMADIKKCELIKRSLDARDSKNIVYVCTFKLSAKGENRYIKQKKLGAVPFVEEVYDFPKYNLPTGKKIIITGAGPAGLFCALCLARAGLCPVVIERGEEVDKRAKTIDKLKNKGILDENSNIQFGEGGAGTFSDGKLTCGVNDIRMQYILKEFSKHGAPEDILVNSKPHIGTDYLGYTVKNIRNEIIALGGQVMFNTLLTDIEISNGTVRAIEVENTKDSVKKRLECDYLVLSIGHSSTKTYEMLFKKGFNMERKPFSVGVRIEHKREHINKIQYKEAFADEALPTADYKLSCHLDCGSAYTFCMCPGGEVVCGASEEGAIVTNGMSNFARDGENSNSAILVSVTPDDIEGCDVLGGMYFQRELEKKAYDLGGGSYRAPCQRVADFLSDVPSKGAGTVIPSYKPGIKFTNINTILPDFVAKTLKEALAEFDKKMPSFCLDDALLTAVETRSSAPVRILRDKSFQSNINGVYPIGEGAGYAGGIMSSAADGIKCAEKICEMLVLY